MTKQSVERIVDGLRRHLPSQVVDYALGDDRLSRSREVLTDWFVHRLLTDTIRRVDGGALATDALRLAVLNLDEQVTDTVQRRSLGSAARYVLVAVDHCTTERRPVTDDHPGPSAVAVDPVVHARIENLRRLIKPTGSSDR